MSASHGTAVFGANKDCLCEECVAERRRLYRTRRYNRELGRPALVDAEPARQHALRLIAAGATEFSIARACGVHESSILGLVRGRKGNPPSKKIRRATAAKVLATRQTTETLVPSVGSRRRYYALLRIGHSQKDIAAAVGVSFEAIQQRLNHERITRESHESMHRAYLALRNVQGTSTFGLWVGMRNHVPPPGAWDDDTIDDPAATPGEWACCVEGCGGAAKQMSLCSGHILAAGGLHALRRNRDGHHPEYQRIVQRLVPLKRGAAGAADERIRELYDLGVRDPARMAARLGLTREAVVNSATRLNLTLIDSITEEPLRRTA